MNDNQNRRLASFITSRDYFAQVSNQYAPNGVAQQKAARFGAVITEIQTKAAEQEGGIGQTRQHTLGRKEARTELRLDLEAINRAARIMGLESEFPRPPDGNDKELLNAARAFARNAQPLKTQFIAHEMPEDFLEDLAADIAAFETRIAEQSDARGGHVAAGEVVDDLFDEGTELQRDLDGFMRNKFANNAEVLAEWTRASHVERAPRRKKPGGSPTPPPQTA
jgi:hypothetical protein